MKLFIPLYLVILSGFLVAYDYVEVKRASGTSYSYRPNNLYVCYDKRIKVVSDGQIYLSYRGCTRESIKCSRLGKVHFGKYPSNSKASNALWRCRNAKPRFVD
jgi:hypothetical protein